VLQGVRPFSSMQPASFEARKMKQLDRNTFEIAMDPFPIPT
jgi:hypothetical protein